FAGAGDGTPSLVQPKAPRALAGANPLQWTATNFQPAVPTANQKLTFILYIQNVSGKKTPKGNIALWSNLPAPAGCGMAGDSELRLPALDPMEFATLTASVPLGPADAGPTTVRMLVDSTCVVSMQSPELNQASFTAPSLSTLDTRSLAFVDGAPLDMAFWNGDEMRVARTDPKYPLGEPKFNYGVDTYSVIYAVQNSGSVPIADGLRLAVYAGKDVKPPPPCGDAGDGSVRLPQLKDGDIKDITVEGLKPPTAEEILKGQKTVTLTAYLDADCVLYKDPAKRPRSVSLFQPTPFDAPIMEGVRLKGDQAADRIKITYPRVALKVGGAFSKFTARFEIGNGASGAGRGAVGAVYVWVRPLDEDNIGGYYKGSPCNFKDWTAKASFPDVLIKDIPVPQVAGSYILSAVADGDCDSSPAQQSVVRNMAVTPTYTAFYVEP
ncbi:hypothetical protein Rsub_13402, partial [Raphidocelis subcapitata]